MTESRPMSLTAENIVAMLSLMTGRSEQELTSEAVMEKWGSAFGELTVAVDGIQPPKDAMPKKKIVRRRRTVGELPQELLDTIARCRPHIKVGTTWRVRDSKTRTYRELQVMSRQEHHAVMRNVLTGNTTQVRYDHFCVPDIQHSGNYRHVSAETARA